MWTGSAEKTQTSHGGSGRVSGSPADTPAPQAPHVWEGDPTHTHTVQAAHPTWGSRRGSHSCPSTLCLTSGGASCHTSQHDTAQKGCLRGRAECLIGTVLPVHFMRHKGWCTPLSCRTSQHDRKVVSENMQSASPHHTFHLRGDQIDTVFMRWCTL